MIRKVEANKAFVTCREKFAFTVEDLPAVLSASIDGGTTWHKIKECTSDDGTLYVVNNAPEGLTYKINKDIKILW